MHGRLQILPLIILGILIGLNGYAYIGITGISHQISPSSLMGIKIIFFSLFAIAIVSVFVVFFGGNRLSKSLRNFFFAGVFMSLTSALIFDVFVLFDDFVRSLLWIVGFGDFTRSIYIISTGFVISILPTLLFSLGMVIGPYRYKVRKTTIQLDNLPTAFDQLKIVQISDVHSGSFYNKKAVEKGINMILDQEADIIFFTGDLVNDDATEMYPYKSLFSRLRAPLGVFSILGNHDYGDYVQWPSQDAKLNNLNRLKEIHGEMGWRLLLNEHVYIERHAERIGLIGVENWGKGFHQFGDLEKAYSGCDAPVKLLLSHDPTHWDEQVTKDYKDIDITFSGHTHGAQMGFEIGKYKWSPITLRYKKWAGLYQLEKQYMYINRGFGFLGYPGRLGIWPEISVITLSKSQ